MDKQIISNVLNSTITDLEKKQAYIESSNDELLRQKIAIEKQNKILEEQKKIIQENSNYKDRFLANISHELRTPLNGILGVGYLLQNELESAQALEYIGIINSSAHNLLVIVNDLLDISRLTAHTLSIENRPFALDALLNNIYTIIKLQADERQLRFRMHLSPKLPNYLLGDGVRLYQILINFLTNAIKFTYQGSIHLFVEQQDDQSDPQHCQLLFTVKDTGIGIAPTELNTIFDDFKQVYKTDTKRGLGLGLSIVKQLTTLMSGKIVVESQPNIGSSFSVQLQFGVVSQYDIVDRQTQEHQTSISRQWTPKRVLLIEDNAVNRLYAENLFKQWHLHTDVAENLATARQQIVQHAYNAIFVDIELPDGNGFDFIQWLQQHPNNANSRSPIIILSAAMSDEYAKAASLVQVAAYMIKPFSPERLFAEVAKLFGKQSFLPQNTLTVRKSPHTTDKQAEYLAHLKKILKGNKKNIKEIIEISIHQLELALNEIPHYIAQNQWNEVFLATHRLKSTVRTLGLEQLLQHIMQLEQLTQQPNPAEQQQQLFAQFKQAVLAEIPQLKNEWAKM